jgi:CRISPR-associated protein Cas6/Cse3/CasE subtype I-E
MHKNIMRLYSPSENSVARYTEKILYRIVEQQNEIMLYLTSSRLPDMRQTAWINSHTVRQCDLQPLVNRFAPGQTFSFDLLTHPSKKVIRTGANSRRVFLRTAQERADWLRHQGEKGGFRVVSLQEDTPFDLHGKRSTGNICLRAVRMMGRLEITDTVRFADAYQSGIGPEKAYGMGMLLLGG